MLIQEKHIRLFAVSSGLLLERMEKRSFSVRNENEILNLKFKKSFNEIS